METDWSEVEKVLRDLGFDVWLGGNNHYRACHPALVQDPSYLGGTITISAHNKGHQGKVGRAGMRDVLRASEVAEAYNNAKEEQEDEDGEEEAN